MANLICGLVFIDDSLYVISEVSGKGAYFIGGRNITRKAMGIPQFGSTRKGESVFIKYREFIQDIQSQGSGGFEPQGGAAFQLNPGLNTDSGGCFDWLSNIAACFEEYKWKGLMFHFKSTSANAMSSTATTLGEVIMATQYNALNAPFADATAMMQYQFAVDGKPSRDLTHGVEVSRKSMPVDELYVRTGPPPAGADVRLYDIGQTTVAVNGFPSGGGVSVLGQLWVVYSIELMKPKMGAVGGDNTLIDSDHFVLPYVPCFAPF